MKKKLLVFLCVSVLMLSALVSCKITTGNGKDNVPDAFYSEGSKVGIIIADGNAPSEKIEKLTNAFYGFNVLPEIIDPAKKTFDHELVIGKSDREVSKKAYICLSRMDPEEHHSCYVIYSDGKSIGVAYDHESALEAAIDSLLEKYFTSDSLTIAAGVHEQTTISILDYYAKIDEANKEKAFENLEKNLGPEYGPAIVEALKEYYATLNPDVVKWFANLYDPDIGGYYFSNSGRNTPGYLPDLESTSQALGFFENMGVKAADVISDEMKQKMGQFAYEMQQENGFFYHKQWSKELTDTKLSRRARDLGHAKSLLALAGLTPKYPYATDQIEGAEPAPMSLTVLPSRLGSSSVAAVSKVVSTATPDHLKSEEAFLTYLRGLGVYNNSYGPGNQISSQFSQIMAAGLANVCVEYFESIQNPKNGLWEDAVTYGAIDGLLKISGMWAQVGKVFPHAKEAIKSTIEVIMIDEPSGCVVEMYNCWYSIRNINDSMKYATGSEGTEFVKEVRNTLYALAPEALRLCQQKVAVCQKPDGSFSWGEKYSSATSQGVPVAVPNSIEGDINATVIGFSGTIGNFMHAIGQPKIPILGKRELYIYLDTLEKLGTIVKDEDIVIGEPFNFDDGAIGAAPKDFKIGEGTSAVVAEDPVDPKNRVLHLESFPGKGDIIYIPNTVGMDASCMVFTGDFYVSSETTKGYFMQITMDKCYLFTLQTDSDGKIKVIDANSTTDSATIYTTYDVSLNFDEWFNIKIEYYVGDKDTVRIKAYVNGTLVCVSDNYWDSEGKKFTQNIAPGTNAVETRLYCMQGSRVDMYLDNLHTYKLKSTYAPAVLDNPKAPNVDAPDKEELIYDFDGDIAEDVDYMENGASDRNSDKIVVFDGHYVYNNNNEYDYSSAGVTESEFNGSKSLKIATNGSVAKLQIPTTVRTSTANCGTLGFDIQVVDAAIGDFATVKFYDKNTSANSGSVLMGITLSCIEDNDAKYVVLKEMPGGVVSAQLDGVKIKIGDIVNMRFEFFHAEDATLVFINGVSAAASYALSSGGHKFTLGYASIETNAKVPSTIQLDNVKCERIERDYATATAPNVDREVVRFDNTNGYETSGTTSLTSVSDNKVLKVGSDGKVIIPINHRSPVVNITTFETMLSFASVANGTKSYIKIVDDNMQEIFAIAITGNGSSMVARELTKYGETGNILNIFEKDVNYILKLEICPSKETVNILVNDTPIYVTNVFFADEKLEEKPVYLVFESAGSQFSIDDIYAEAVNTVFVQCKPTVGANKEDTETKYTFEYSSAVSLPSKVTKTLISSGASIRIKSIFKDEKLSNALKFTTTNGGCDTLNFNSMSTVAGATCATFEADLLFEDFEPGSSVTQLNIGEAYMFNISTDKKTGRVYIGALTAGSNAGRVWGKSVELCDINTWVHIRIDVFTGDMSSTLAKVYINEQLVIVTNNYKGYRNNTETPVAPSSNVSFAKFYTYGAAQGSIYLDNVSVNYNTTSRGNDEINDQRPAYVAPAS